MATPPGGAPNAPTPTTERRVLADSGRPAPVPAIAGLCPRPSGREGGCNPCPNRGRTSMRSNRLWIGVTCGVALALGGVAAVDAGTQTAGAQADTSRPRPSSAFRLEGTSRSPVHGEHRSARDRPENGGARPQRSSCGPAWTRRGTSPPRARPVRSFTSAQSSGTGQAKGDYVVDFKTDVSACSWSASPFLVGNAAATRRSSPPSPHRPWRPSRRQGEGLDITVWHGSSRRGRDAHRA